MMAWEFITKSLIGSSNDHVVHISMIKLVIYVEYVVNVVKKDKLSKHK